MPWKAAESVSLAVVVGLGMGCGPSPDIEVVDTDVDREPWGTAYGGGTVEVTLDGEAVHVAGDGADTLANPDNHSCRDRNGAEIVRRDDLVYVHMCSLEAASWFGSICGGEEAEALLFEFSIDSRTGEALPTEPILGEEGLGYGLFVTVDPNGPATVVTDDPVGVEVVLESEVSGRVRWAMPVWRCPVAPIDLELGDLEVSWQFDASVSAVVYDAPE